MRAILPFPTERCRPAQEVEHGHNCLLIPFPGQEQAPATPKTRKPAKAKTVTTNGKPKTKRGALITKVKIAQKQLGIGDADYRVLLQMNFGVDSSTELEERELVQLIGHFRSKGWKDRPARQAQKDRHGKPFTMKIKGHPTGPTLKRIEALLAELGKARGKFMPWSYAAAILEGQTGLHRLEQATVRELQNVMVALEKTLTSCRMKRAKV